MGIENVEALSGGEGESKQESGVERETDQEIKDRQNKELEAERKERQERLGQDIREDDSQDESESETST